MTKPTTLGDVRHSVHPDTFRQDVVEPLAADLGSTLAGLAPDLADDLTTAAAAPCDSTAYRMSLLTCDRLVDKVLAPWCEQTWNKARALLEAHPEVGSRYDETLADVDGYPVAHRDFGQLAQRHQVVRQLHLRCTLPNPPEAKTGRIVGDPFGFLLHVSSPPWSDDLWGSKFGKYTGNTAVPVVDDLGRTQYWPLVTGAPWPDLDVDPRAFLAWLAPRSDHWTPTAAERHARADQLQVYTRRNG